LQKKPVSCIKAFCCVSAAGSLDTAYRFLQLRIN
jgi:hypothetical protein